MKKYALGAVIGIGIAFGGYAVAYEATDMSVVDRFIPLNTLSVIKIYDKAANVVCYVYQGTAISCLKNN